MKQFMFGCFAAFWASVMSIWAYAVLAAGATESTASAAETVVTAAELSRHGAADDCWMAIDGVVYDLSEYIPEHPAPAGVMTPWCGREASEAYHTKGYARPHSPAADAQLPRYRVGTLAGDRVPSPP
jgi:cytochrome b involved in lipid metabolism